MCNYCGNELKQKIISTKSFEKVYGISKETQKQLRKRIKHPLPYLQFAKNGNIFYSIEIIDKWIENYIKNL